MLHILSSTTRNKTEKHQQNPFNGNEIICEKVNITHYEKYVTRLKAIIHSLDADASCWIQ